MNKRILCVLLLSLSIVGLAQAWEGVKDNRAVEALLAMTDMELKFEATSVCVALWGGGPGRADATAYFARVLAAAKVRNGDREPAWSADLLRAATTPGARPEACLGPMWADNYMGKLRRQLEGIRAARVPAARVVELVGQQLANCERAPEQFGGCDATRRELDEARASLANLDGMIARSEAVLREADRVEQERTHQVKEIPAR